MAFSDRLTQLRINRELSQEELAEAFEEMNKNK